jgi:hypothetical protein
MQDGTHPEDEKNLDRIVEYLSTEFRQPWTRDAEAGPTFLLRTLGVQNRHFVAISDDFLKLVRFKDNARAVVAGRGLAERLRQAKGRRRVLVTKIGLRWVPLNDADREPPPPRRPRGRPRKRPSSRRK